MRDRKFVENIAQYLRDEMDKLSDDELDQVMQECRAMTETNCDWLEYHLRFAIYKNAESYIRTRQYWKDKKQAELDCKIVE